MNARIPALALPKNKRVSLPDFGPAAPKDRHLTVEIDGSDPQKANAAALDALMDGASSILFRVRHCSDIPSLAAGIDSSIAPIHWAGDLDPVLLAEALAHSLGDSSEGLIHRDPLEQRARTGSWSSASWEQDLKGIRRAEAILPEAMAALTSNASWASAQGAEGQLAWALASLQAMQPAPGRPVGLIVEATKDYFETVSMVQAARLLWTDNPLWILGRAGGTAPSDDAADLADRALAAQALALGGCRDLCIAPINESAQAARWARHQGLVLYYETGLLQQEYPLRGSYLLEQWTADLAEAARNQTAQWNRRGGLVELLNRNENLWN